MTATVNEVMRLYNEALAEVVKDARARQSRILSGYWKKPTRGAVSNIL
jgi:hypothetical protein